MNRRVNGDGDAMVVPFEGHNKYFKGIGNSIYFVKRNKFQYFNNNDFNSYQSI